MPDIEVGDPDFDESFIIKGSNEGRVRDLFDNPEMRQMNPAQPKIRPPTRTGVLFGSCGSVFIARSGPDHSASERDILAR